MTKYICTFIVIILGVFNQLSATELTFKLGSTNGSPWDKIRVPLSVSGFTNIKTLQFSMHWNPLVMGFTKVVNFGLEGLSQNNFGKTLTNDGTLTISWDDLQGLSQTLPDGAVLVELEFTLGAACQNTLVSINGSPTPVEISDNNFNILTPTMISGTVVAHCDFPIITSFSLAPVPTDVPNCTYQFDAYHVGAELPYWRICYPRIYSLATVEFTTEIGKSYRVQIQFSNLSPTAVENSELGWLLISPTIPGTGSITNFQFGVPNSIGFIRIKQL